MRRKNLSVLWIVVWFFIGSVTTVFAEMEERARDPFSGLSNENVQRKNTLVALHAELIQIKHAKASDIARFFDKQKQSLLSPDGLLAADERTNQLWVRDTRPRIREIRTIIQQLDIPVKQVLIEARLVIVNKDIAQDLGVRFGLTRPSYGFSRREVGANVDLKHRLNLDLPVPSEGKVPPATLGLALAELGSNILLDLELSALESEGRAEIISSPRLITANQQTARIESGEEVPMQEAAASGGTVSSFRKAVLSLEVTPQITADNKVMLDLAVHQDAASDSKAVNNVPIILTKQLHTHALVDDGKTIVLGGVYKQTKSKHAVRVPLLAELPVLGVLFRRTQNTLKQEELLIFITPKIIREFVELAPPKHGEIT